MQIILHSFGNFVFLLKKSQHLVFILLSKSFPYIIAIEYFPEENSQTLNEYDYIENAGPIYKYVTVDESSESSSKN